MADLGKGDLPVFDRNGWLALQFLDLWVGETIVAIVSLVPGEARGFAFLAPFEESLERFVYSLERILQDLGIDLFVLWPDLFDGRKLGRLVIVGDADTAHTVCFTAFLKGRIEEIPLPAASVDVIISNCVINLSADKSLVLRDAFRVLRPGGRFAVADVVADGPVSPALQKNMEAWVGCLAGALDVSAYAQMLRDAGFPKVANLSGGLKAWVASIDSSLPRYW